jgi:hypothetical protein
MIKIENDEEIKSIHNDLIDIVKNTTINRFNSMEFIQFPHYILSDKISTNFSVKYNNTIIFSFTIWSNISISNIESTHKKFNFNIRHNEFICCSKFISNIEYIVLTIISNHNLIRSKFNTIKPIISADKLFFDNHIYVLIYTNYYELNIHNNTIVYKSFDEFKNNKHIRSFRKLSIYDRLFSLFSLFS